MRVKVDVTERVKISLLEAIWSRPCFYGAVGERFGTIQRGPGSQGNRAGSPRGRGYACDLPSPPAVRMVRVYVGGRMESWVVTRQLTKESRDFYAAGTGAPYTLYPRPVMGAEHHGIRRGPRVCNNLARRVPHLTHSPFSSCLRYT